MEPGIGGIVRDEIEDHSITDDESHDGDDGVDQTEDLKPQTGGPRP